MKSFFRIPRIRWRHAIGEVLLIFIGINLSFLFNSWNEKRLDRQKEIKTLSEFKTCLLANLNSLDEIIEWEQSVINCLESTMASLTGDGVLDDSVMYNLSFIVDYDIPHFDNSAYDQAAGYGLSFISNDSIRTSLSRMLVAQELFDWIERSFDEHKSKFIFPIIYRDFVKFESYKKAVPEDYKKLKENNELPRILSRSVRLHKANIGRCEEIKAATLKTLGMIENDLKK